MTTALTIPQTAPPETPAIQLWPLAPELVLIGMGLLVLMVEAFARRRDQRVMAALAVVGSAGSAGATLYLWNAYEGPQSVLVGMVTADRFSLFLRLVLLGVAVIAVALSYHYLDRADEARGEFYALLLFATSGMTLMVAALDLIVVFLGLEILSLSLYLMTGFSFRRLTSAEAAMKYFLLGAFSSAFFLYGIALAYGASGTTRLSGIALALNAETGDLGLAFAAAGLLAVGFAFKVAAVPFHMWTPDAYQGAPTAVTAFMSAATKVAAFGAFLRVFELALAPLIWDWRPFVWVLAAVTMVVGSVLAIAQTDVKRMLAYSSIAHAGFILVGAVAGTKDGIESAMFYLAAYAVMILGAFGVVMLVSVRGERDTALDAYAGLSRRSPVLAALLTLFLLSLAGIPPTAGFVAKVLVFGAAVGAGYWPLVLIAVIASVVAAFFYIRVIMLMWMTEPAEGAQAIEGLNIAGVAVWVPAALTVLLGVLPGLLLGFLESASVITF